MEQIKICSLKEFLDELQKHCPPSDDLMYFYRGEGISYSEDISNMPKVFTEGRLENEDRIIKEAIQQFPDVYTSRMSTFQKLVRMRHYGLAVRLLDISLSPLVALFFACCGSDVAKQKEGHVYIFKRNRSEIKYYDSDLVCLLSNLSYMKYNFDVSQEGALMHQIKSGDRSDFYYMFGDNLENLNTSVCVIPQYNNARVRIQQGAFFLFGLQNGKKAEFKVTPDYDFSISQDSFEEIIVQLNSFGINKITLFPEEENVFTELNKKFITKK
jgi:hypothetical protein